jgi:response regulator RpfG family c-di-GMP phosphodiesterase
MTSDQETTDPGTKPGNGHRHRALVVDDDAPAGKAIGRVLEREGIEFVSVLSGEEGIAAIETAKTPFSLILSDQRMPGMQGTQFLSRAKEMTPDTIRYLITGYSEMETILNAVNKGAVQHYIAKPWDRDELRQVIRAGIVLYEQHLDSENLFSLAKKQNAKLYDLNCELVEGTKALENQRDALNRDIDALKARLTQGPGGSDTDPAQVIEALSSWLKQEGRAKQYDALKRHTLTSLYEQFTDLALRNGLEMPGIRLGSGSAGGQDA